VRVAAGFLLIFAGSWDLPRGPKTDAKRQVVSFQWAASNNRLEAAPWQRRVMGLTLATVSFRKVHPSAQGNQISLKTALGERWITVRALRSYSSGRNVF
jgi:hypothetical protein